ncbi:hypothetical protein AOZ07_01350 [Glutamicibacter halophytocola]|uniref:hypothetical protein n=1 Tax=Glutamicibacter halophytocola TaxID=1933880 RepID=UPI0006D4AD11|nr:hypothetical protein [Glutamicibacter halophytocola]ALG27774.1 hypothetical protein AOZ07_01350 [Glutamicibacter halophytocola]
MDLNQRTDSANSLVLTVVLLGSLAWMPRPTFRRRKKLTSAAGMPLDVSHWRTHKSRHAQRVPVNESQIPQMRASSKVPEEE